MEALWKKYAQIILRLLWIAFTLVVMYFILIRGIFYVMPFFVAAIIALIIENPVDFLEKKIKLQRSFAVLIVLLLFVAIFGTLFILMVSRIITEMVDFSTTIPSNDTIMNFIENILGRGKKLYISIPPDVLNLINDNLGKNLDEIVRTVTGYITTTLKTAINTTIGVVTSLPSLLIFLLVTLISTFFISKDRTLITRFWMRQIPKGWREKIRSVKNDLLVALAGFMKAQAILVSITFTILLIGYTLMGLDYALFMAIFTSIVDILPVLGTGSVIIPWAVLNVLVQNYPMAMKLIILYGVILTVRQVLEPKLVGKGIGLHPLVALFSMYVGLKLLGVKGLILGPVIAIILKALQKAKILPAWK